MENPDETNLQSSDPDVTVEFTPVPEEDLDKALFEKNMAAFVRFQPYLADNLGAVTSPHSQLVTDGDGGYDVEFRGTYLFGMAGHRWGRERVAEMRTARGGTKRLLLSPLDSHNLDRDANTTIHRIVQRSAEAGMSFSTQPIDNRCFHLVIFGVGLGDHIIELMRLTDCQHVVLVEPNIEFLYWSMYVYDWADLYQSFVTRHRKISFVIDTDFRIIAERTRDRMRYINPGFMDSAYFFAAYPGSVMKAAIDLLLSQSDLFVTGLGFLEDEMDMVRNSYHNLKNYEGLYYQEPPPDEVRPFPAFVIGAGPSLDNDLEFIRENQDRAIIISCGTAIRVLLANGIKPDFQMEIENVPAVTELTRLVARKFDLSGITLIGSTTIDPGVQELYDRTVFYFRLGLSSYPLFEQGLDSAIQYSTPNIANLGFAFSQNCGYRQTYLFGVDLGARDPKKHHADDAAYNVGEVEFDTKIDRPAPANFGGDVYTELVYQWAKATIEEALERFAHRSYFNCSDGVRITGMVPKLSSEIELPEAGDKSRDVEEIVSRFANYSREHFRKSWAQRDPVRRVKRFRDLILTRCGAKRLNPRLTDGGIEDGYDIKPARDTDMREEDAAELDKEKKSWESDFPFTYMCEVTRDMIPNNSSATSEMHYFRGSTFMSMAAIYFYYQRVLNAGENREKFLDIVREEFVDQTIRIADVILKFYETLEPAKKSRRKPTTKPAKKAVK